MANGNLRQFSPADEYVQLRTEMTHLHVSVRTLWGSLLVAFVGAIGAIIALLSNALRDDSGWTFIPEALAWASVVLAALPSVGIYLGYLWFRQIYYLGSYLIAAHEDGWTARGWLAHNRNATGILANASASLRISLLHSAVAMFVLGLFPGAFGFAFGLRLEAGLNHSFAVPIVIVIMIAIFFIFFARRFYALSAERKAFTEAWRQQLPGLRRNELV